MGWDGTEQREQHPKLLADTEVKVICIHMQHSSSHQQDTWLTLLRFLPNSLVPLEGEQAMAAFLFCKKTYASKSLFLRVLFHICSHYNTALFSKHIPTLWNGGHMGY